MKLTDVSTFAHWRRLAPAGLCFDPVENAHARAARREIALDLGVPVAAITLGKPVQKGRLLFGGQRLDCVLDLCEVHVLIVPVRASAQGTDEFSAFDSWISVMPR